MKNYIFAINLILIVLLNSCSKDESLPIDSYKISVENRYFERIDSIFVGQYFEDSLLVNQISRQLKLKKNSYTFSCITYSKLKFSAIILIQGQKEYLKVLINESGKISIE
jgi:hypothetical protein